MKGIFADSFYWIALSDPRDAWHQIAVDKTDLLGDIHIVTTEAVLIEYVNFFSRYGEEARRQVVTDVYDLLTDAITTVVEQGPASLTSGLSLYSSRPDKEYSLTDCISMELMRERKITEVLTHDDHFRQEGFVVLL